VPAAIGAAAATGKPVIVYPNSGEHWDPASRNWVGTAQFSPEAAAQWASAGARVIGGCCRVRPVDIAGLATVLT
jgi:homocysteine S-methyltransferase